MLLNKIIIVGMLLISISSVAAWDAECGLSEDELFDIMFNSAYLYTDIENPKWYNPITAIDDLLVSFTGFFTDTPPNLRVQVYIKKMVWTGDHYVEDTDFVDLESSTYFQFKVNTSEKITIPVFKHMKEVLNNNLDEYNNFKTVDEDKNHPDILNISISIGEDGETLDFNSFGYITFTDTTLNELESQNGLIDYGFISSGMGSDAGSGGIYEGLNVYGANDDGTAHGMGDAFKMLFYITIPILFILCVLKFVFAIIGG